MKSFPKQLVMVDITVDPKVEEEWNIWYDQVHLPDILGCPGFIHAARYVCDEAGARRYLTVYEVTGDGVMESAEFSNRRGWGRFKEYVRSSVRTCRQVSASRGDAAKEADTWYWEKTWGDFRRGQKRIKLSWADGEAVALIYDEGVPETAAAILRSLPLSVPIVHAAWSGPMVMSAKPFDIPAKKEENRTRLCRPGDLTWDPKFGELAFAYDNAEGRLPSGANTVVVFGAVVDGLEGFVQFCRSRRFEGLGVIDLKALD